MIEGSVIRKTRKRALDYSSKCLLRNIIVTLSSIYNNLDQIILSCPRLESIPRWIAEVCLEKGYSSGRECLQREGSRNIILEAVEKHADILDFDDALSKVNPDLRMLLEEIISLCNTALSQYLNKPNPTIEDLDELLQWIADEFSDDLLMRYHINNFIEFRNRYPRTFRRLLEWFLSKRKNYQT